MIVITGRTGVGKSTIIRKSKVDNYIEIDSIIKNIFYKRNFRLYWDIKKEFGNKSVSFLKVKTKTLGKIVFSDEKKLAKLNQIVKPYIRAYLMVLKESKLEYIVEMAIYMVHEEWYKDLFNKVILIDRKPHLEHKFTYLNKAIQPINNIGIHSDLTINTEDLHLAVKKLDTFLKLE